VLCPKDRHIKRLNAFLHIDCVPRIATRNIQIRSAPANKNISDHRTGAASRNNHAIGYVKRHSRQILSVAISMPRLIYRPTITCDQGRTGAVINCIKLHESKENARHIYMKHYAISGARLAIKYLKNTSFLLTQLTR